MTEPLTPEMLVTQEPKSSKMDDFNQVQLLEPENPEDFAKVSKAIVESDKERRDFLIKRNIIMFIGIVGHICFVVGLKLTFDYVYASYNADKNVIFNNSRIPQDSQLVLDYISKNCLIPPNFGENVKIENQPGPEPEKLEELMKNNDLKFILGQFNLEEMISKKHAFVEIGHGDENSVTFTLEKYFNWKGLLLESDIGIVHKLLIGSKKDLTISTCTCLSKMFPQKIPKPQCDSKDPKDKKCWKECFPLHSMIKSAKIMDIHYLQINSGLDNYDFIYGFPFDVFHIKVININKKFQDGKYALLEEFLKALGYSQSANKYFYMV